MVTVEDFPAIALGVEMGKENRKHTACELAGAINWFVTFKLFNELDAAIKVPVW